MADITTTTTHGLGADLVSATDLHLLFGVRIMGGRDSIMVLDLDSTMADLDITGDC
jgi:hypothetical protein